jgi:uncharacterized membrane protein
MNKLPEPSAASLANDMQLSPQTRPFLLWLASAFWLVSGVSGLIPILLSIPSFSQFPPSIMLFVSTAALSQILSLLGAVQLLRRKQSAINLLVLVFILGAATSIFSNASLANMSTSGIIIWLLAGVTVGYALLLKKKGVLT